MTDTVEEVEETPEEDDLQTLAEGQGIDDATLKEIFEGDVPDEPGGEPEAVEEAETPDEPEAPAEEAPVVPVDEVDKAIKSRDGVLGELNRVRKELAEMKAKSEAPVPAPVTAPVDGEEPDEFQSLLADVAETKALLAEQRERDARREEVQHLQTQLSQAAAYRQAHEEEFVKEVPTYHADVAAARQAITSQLISQGVTPEDAERTLLMEEAKATLEARRTGQDTAKVIYGFLQQNGLVQPAEAQEAGPTAPVQIAPKRPAKKSLSDLGGSPPVGGDSQEKWIEDNPEEFAKIAEDPEKFEAFVRKWEG